MDRLEPLLQNISNGGGTWKEYDVRYENVLAKKSVIQKGSEHLWQFAKELIEQSVQNGALKL